ncbi:MAG: histidine kinase, partial [Prolixibacteraceae bacterium]|nr:histidine kinase [Prolixibacteraceae bacterium]
LLKELVLTYHENVLSFDFVSLDYNDPGKNHYAYKLSGFDREWNEVGNQNMATYTNLNPGKYVFMVRGTNSDGIWNPVPAELKITIIPPVWKTWWFFAILAGLTLILVRSIFIDQKRKVQKEKELIELQLKSIKSQIDPHFAFNALNTMAALIYENEPDTTYDYFTRFAYLIRNILNDNEKISRSLGEEIDFVKNYLELQKIRFKDKFEYSIFIDPGISAETPIPKMIIQSYVENAVKHGLMHRPKDGQLSIWVEKTGYCIRIVVTDNGVGRQKAAGLSTGSTGKGLKIMNRIFRLYKKLYHTDIIENIEDLTGNDGKPEGTRVILELYTLPQPHKTTWINFLKPNKHDT